MRNGYGFTETDFNLGFIDLDLLSPDQRGEDGEDDMIGGGDAFYQHENSGGYFISTVDPYKRVGREFLFYTPVGDINRDETRYQIISFEANNTIEIKDEFGNLRYYEITNGQHFDAFLPNAAGGGVQGYDTLFVPVHYYFIKGMDLMWARLKNGTALPPSQVVRTSPRGGAAGAAPAISVANVPNIAATPSSGDLISASSGAISLPN